MTTKLTIGDKVKQMRKAKGLTQTDLAGEHMTKSMLSQIENGRALPSMNTLQFLAGRLGTDAGYFLEGEHEAELGPLVRKIEQQYKAKQYKEIVAEIQPLMKDTLPMAVDAARLMEFYVGSCYHTGTEGGEEGIERAVEIYERFGLFVERAKIQYLAYALMFAKSRYQDGLELIRRVRKEYVNNKVGNDFYLRSIFIMRKVLRCLHWQITPAAGKLPWRHLSCRTKKESTHCLIICTVFPIWPCFTMILSRQRHT